MLARKWVGHAERAKQSGHRRAFVTVSRGKATFRKADAKRLIKAAESAGIKIGRIECDRAGKITLVPANGNAVEEEQRSLDDWMASRAHSA